MNSNLHVFDITPVINLINQRTLESFASTRYNNLQDRSVTFRHIVNRLIDELLMTAINSFEFIYVSGYNPNNNSEEERWWFNNNIGVTHTLYETLELHKTLLQSAGTYVKCIRRGLTLYITVETGTFSK